MNCPFKKHFTILDWLMQQSLLNEYSRQTEPAKWSDMNIRFHQALYEPCSNPLLLQMITDLQQRIGPQLRLLVTEVSGLERPQAEHREILDACKAGNTAEAVETLRRHVLTTRKEIAAQMRRGMVGSE
ncbi:FCD domain-containing protein [Pseudophaeobacter sp.]|uniref:GntR family transcriptional regulator n=1 Tax=Pseudophaeobacter sp. TaxID=1971739 RepID=UPI00329A756F